MKISSQDNPLFKSLQRLSRNARARYKESKLVLDGVHLVQAYVERFGNEGVELIVKESAADHPEISALGRGARSVLFADALFDAASEVETPIGIMAIAPMPNPTATSEHGLQLILDGIQDPGNLGSIMRSAAAAGASAIHLSQSCADPWSPRALRGGMGGQFLVQIAQYGDLAGSLRGKSWRLIACRADATRSLFETDLSGDVGLMLGSEGHGLSPELAALAGADMSIPLQPGVESLNVAAAAAVCMFERVRQMAENSKS